MATLGGILMLIGGLSVAGGVFAFLRGQRTLRWPTTPGQIVESSIREEVDSDNVLMHHPVIRYTYTVGGQQHEGNTIHSMGDAAHSNRQQVVRDLAPYPVGAAVDVHYNPANPRQAVLKPGTNRAFTLFLVVLGAPFFVAGAVLVIVF